MSSTKSSWKTDPSDAPQGLILGPILFNTFINLDDGTECLISKFSGYIKLRGVADTTQGCVTIQRDLNRLKKWSDANLLMFNEGKCKFCTWLGANSTGGQPTVWKAALQRKPRMSWLAPGGPRSKNIPVKQRKPRASWAALGRAFPASQGRFFPFSPALVRHIWSHPSSCGFPSERETQIYWTESSEVTQR